MTENEDAPKTQVWEDSAYRTTGSTLEKLLKVLEATKE